MARIGNINYDGNDQRFKAIKDLLNSIELQEIEANPSDTPTESLESLRIDENVYNLGGGTIVIANPSGTPTDELNSIQIGNDIYEIAGGGGGGSGSGRTIVSLWQNEGNTNPDTITLSKAYTNYDDFIVMCYRSANNKMEPEFYNFISDRVLVGQNFACLAWSSSSDYVTYSVTDATTFTKVNQGSHLVIKEVMGIKYSGSSGGSGSGYSITNLWYGEQHGPMEIPLSDDINNYDAIEFVTKISSNGAYNVIVVDAKSFSTKYPYSASVSQNIPHYCLLGYDNLFGRVITGQTTSSIYIWDLSTTMRLAEVNGIKYESGGSGGISAEIIPIADPTNTTSRTFTLQNTPKKVSMSWNTSDNWYFHWEFTWGDGWASWLAKTQTVATTATTGLAKIEYGLDNKSFTITGANASQAANSTGGSGLLFVDYGGSGSGGGEGGTTVIPNPVGEPTEELNTIQIGDDIFEIAGGGGSSFQREIIYSAAAQEDTYILSSPLTDFDAITVFAKGGTNTMYRASSFFTIDELVAEKGNQNARFAITTDGWYSYFSVTDESTLARQDTSSLWVYAIVGIKFGSGCGSGSSYEKNIIYDSGSDTDYAPYSTQIPLTSSIENFDQLLILSSTAGDGGIANHHIEIFCDVETIKTYPLGWHGYLRRYFIADFTNLTYFTYSGGADGESNRLPRIYKVYGIKFGPGSGGSSSPGVNYSTDEQVIGTWIDGKPLYQKTIVANNIYVAKNDTDSQFKHNVSNIETGLVSEIYYDHSNGGTKWVDAHNVQNYSESWAVGSTSIYVVSGEYWNAQATRYWMATIRYTKTTD